MASHRSVLARFVAPLLALSLGLGGCVSNRLEGPIHSAEGPPWVAEGHTAAAPLDTINHRVVMIGDAGLWLEDDPTLAALSTWTEGVSSTVVYLGDNIYNEGLTDDDRERGEKILAQQLAATKARKVFVPGNHDWGFAPTDHTVTSIRNQQTFIDEWADGSASFLPKEGCLGPATEQLLPAGGSSRGVALVLVDPTPWINPALREACPTDETQEGHLQALDETLTAHGNDWVVVASHYPMITGGPHGGLTYGFLADQIIGVLGWMWGGLGNTYEPLYADWIARTQTVMRKNPPLIYAAGHDHNLQILEGGDFVGALVVSGAGAPERVSTVTHIAETNFAHAHPGFIVLDVGLRGENEAAVLRVIENGSQEPVYEQEVKPVVGTP